MFFNLFEQTTEAQASLLTEAQERGNVTARFVKNVGVNCCPKLFSIASICLCSAVLPLKLVTNVSKVHCTLMLSNASTLIHKLHPMLIAAQIIM